MPPRAPRVPQPGPPLTLPRDAAAVLMPILSNQPQEVFGALYLDARHRVLCYREVARGSLAEVRVEPRDVLTPGLLINAAACIVAHCHPSGDPSPSPDDIAMTRRLRDAGDVVGLPVLDHVVIGRETYCSFQETGKL